MSMRQITPAGRYGKIIIISSISPVNLHWFYHLVFETGIPTNTKQHSASQDDFKAKIVRSDSEIVLINLIRVKSGSQKGGKA